jgi:hypothetical protein
MKLSPWEPDLASVVNRIDNGDIDLQPDFQRQEVWPLAKKKKLVDTVLRDWSFPAVHLVVKPDDRMVVLDGQQRLAAIRDFIHNQFAIDGRIAPFDETIERLNGLRFSNLEPSLRRRIENYTIRAFRITEYKPEEPNELFYRLNQPTALTAGEQRNALFGAARDQLKSIVAEFESCGNHKETIGFSNSRMSYDDIFAKFLFFLERKTFGIRSSEGLISERFKHSEPFSENTFSNCIKSIKYFSQSRERVGRYRFNKASVLSWLLFYSRFEYLDSPDFMARFIELEGSASSRYLLQAHSVFENRASLRVSDVSSVVFRDFCLWFAYVHMGYQSLPQKIRAQDLFRISDLLDKREAPSLAHALSERLDIDQWSASL